MLDEAVDIPGLLTTISGKTVNVVSPRPDMIDVEDIATALSHLCRYVGHLEQFYSVAEHSFLVSLCVGDDPLTQLWALHHDDPEYILGDLAAPIKHLPELTTYRLLERRMMAAVCGAFHLPPQEPSIVSIVDTQIRILERVRFRRHAPSADDPCLPVSIAGWEPAHARQMFLQRHFALIAEREDKESREKSQLSPVS